MKKLLIVLLAMVFAFSLAACGGGGDKDGVAGKTRKQNASQQRAELFL